MWSIRGILLSKRGCRGFQIETRMRVAARSSPPEGQELVATRCPSPIGASLLQRLPVGLCWLVCYSRMLTCPLLRLWHRCAKNQGLSSSLLGTSSTGCRRTCIRISQGWTSRLLCDSCYYYVLYHDMLPVLRQRFPFLYCLGAFESVELTSDRTTASRLEYQCVKATPCITAALYCSIVCS